MIINGSANSIGWAFREGATELGMTVHRLDAGLDTGPILAQARIPLTDDDDHDTIVAQLGPVVPDLLRRALARVAAGEPQRAVARSYNVSQSTIARLPPTEATRG